MAYRDQRGDCPRCRGVLDADPRPDEMRLSCVSCGGTFLGNDAMHQSFRPIVEQLQLPPSTVPLLPLRCPVCKEPMRRFLVEVAKGSVTLDRCDRHGVWFDDPELDRILAAVTGRGSPG